jgi:hypothetical protein
MASGEQVPIETDLGRLDVVQGLDGVPSFAELRERASEQAESLQGGRLRRVAGDDRVGLRRLLRRVDDADPAVASPSSPRSRASSIVGEGSAADRPRAVELLSITLTETPYGENPRVWCAEV